MKYINRLANRNFILLIFSDIALIVLSFYTSILFRFDFNIPENLKLLITSYHLAILIALKIFCFRLFSLYRGMWRYTSVWDMINIIKATSLSSFLLTGIAMLTIGFEVISRSVFIIDYIICTGCICTSRLGIRMFFSHVITALKTDNFRSNKKIFY